MPAITSLVICNLLDDFKKIHIQVTTKLLENISALFGTIIVANKGSHVGNVGNSQLKYTKLG
jgi:hypothetical protein